VLENLARAERTSGRIKREEAERPEDNPFSFEAMTPKDESLPRVVGSPRTPETQETPVLFSGLRVGSGLDNRCPLFTYTHNL